MRELLGDIDIYLLDQVLKGRVRPEHRILDAGSGPGRNLRYLLRAGAEVHAIDGDARAIELLAAEAERLRPGYPVQRFRVETIEEAAFADASFDVVIANAVLHFARDADHFRALFLKLWRMIAGGGVFFARLATGIGMQGQLRDLGGGRFRMPDGSDRYLAPEQALAALEREVGATPLEPLKTVVVAGQRAMSTWVLRKPDP